MKRLLGLTVVLGFAVFGSSGPAAGEPPEPSLPYCGQGCLTRLCQCPPGTNLQGEAIYCTQYQTGACG